MSLLQEALEKRQKEEAGDFPPFSSADAAGSRNWLRARSVVAVVLGVGLLAFLAIAAFHFFYPTSWLQENPFSSSFSGELIDPAPSLSGTAPIQKTSTAESSSVSDPIESFEPSGPHRKRIREVPATLPVVDDGAASHEEEPEFVPSATEPEVSERDGENLVGTLQSGSISKDDPAFSNRRELSEPHLSDDIMTSQNARLADLSSEAQVSPKVQPSPVQSFLSAARRFLHEGRPGEALSLYNEILTVHPHHKEALTGVALAMALQGRWSEAAKVFRRVLDRFPNDPVALLNLAICEIQHHEYQSALEHLRLAEKADADPFQVWLYRGMTLRCLNRLDDSIRSYERALVIRPGAAIALWNLAIALEAAERYGEALSIYERLLFSEALTDEDKQAVRERMYVLRNY